MEWTTIFFAIFVASILSLLGVSLADWRRPGRRAAEAIAYSVLFFAVILFMSVLAASVWLPVMGGDAWPLPWMSLFIVALLVFLLIAAVSAQSHVEPEDIATLGLGAAFWLLMAFLFAVLMAGIVH